MNDAETILDEATRITSVDRQKEYGHPRDNHACTAAMHHAYLIRKGWTPPASEKGENTDYSPRDVCMFNILQKVSRDANANKRDNLVDIAGWARNAEMLLDEVVTRVRGFVRRGSS